VNAKCFELREREDNRATSVDTSYTLRLTRLLSYLVFWFTRERISNNGLTIAFSVSKLRKFAA
jgi:hypothetical protein